MSEQNISAWGHYRVKLARALNSASAAILIEHLLLLNELEQADNESAEPGQEFEANIDAVSDVTGLSNGEIQDSSKLLTELGILETRLSTSFMGRYWKLDVDRLQAILSVYAVVDPPSLSI